MYAADGWKQPESKHNALHGEWGGDSRGTGRERAGSLNLLAELTGRVRGPHENSQACKARVRMLTSHSPLRCINR